MHGAFGDLVVQRILQALLDAVDRIGLLAFDATRLCAASRELTCTRFGA